jgi:DNA-binding IclR family transcriptional regulator
MTSRPKNVAADRVLSVLSAFRAADGDFGVSEIATAVGLDKSVVHRILATLVSHGFVDRDPETRRYRVGLGAWELGQRYTAIAAVSRTVTPLLRRLVEEFGGTGYLARLEGLEIVYVGVVQSRGPLRVHVEVGSRGYAHATAVGKAMLACLPEPELHARLGPVRSLPTRTEATIGSKARLVAELERVRADGYALNRGEHIRGVGSVGAAIRDEAGSPLAGVSVGFPMLEEFEPLWDDLPQPLTALVAEAGARLGSYSEHRYDGGAIGSGGQRVRRS